MSHEERDPVGRLIRLAGAGTPLEPERRDRLEAAFRSAWQGRLARRGRQRRIRGALLGLAAAAAFGFLFLRPQPAIAPPDAVELRVVRVEGAPMRLRGESTSKLRTDDGLRTGDRLLTGAGRLALQGAGGASIRFDRHSDVILAGAGTIELRSGALYSDSGSGRGRLRVDTSAGRIVEIGTRFQVRVGAKSVEVGVRSGQVALERGEARWVAGAGEVLVAGSDPEPAEAPLRRPLEPTDTAWAWVQEISPSFSLEGKSLSEYLEWLERETGLRVRFAEADLAGEAATVLHGDLNGIRPDETLALVMPSVGWTWTVDADENLILAPEEGP
jgi:ferric-dicitrate binding protein FerR (iron transport regulator)